jgi:hypothetical protein
MEQTILLKDLSFSDLISLRNYFLELKEQVIDPQGIPRINNLDKAMELKDFDFDGEIIYLDRFITGKYKKIKTNSINPKS